MMRFVCLPQYSGLEKDTHTYVIPISNQEILCNGEHLPALVHKAVQCSSAMKQGEWREIFTHEGTFLLLHVGYDAEKESYDPSAMRKAYAGVSSLCRSRGWSKLAVFPPSLGLQKHIGAMTEGLIFSNYSFDLYKSKKKEEVYSLIEEIVWIGPEAEHCIPWSQKSLTLLHAMNLTRNLVNDNAYVVNSNYLVKEAKKLEQNNVKVTAWGKKEIEDHN